MSRSGWPLGVVLLVASCGGVSNLNPGTNDGGQPDGSTPVDASMPVDVTTDATTDRVVAVADTGLDVQGADAAADSEPSSDAAPTDGEVADGPMFPNCGPTLLGCPASATCIPIGSCCQSGDCFFTGQVCRMAGGMCQCPSGTHTCQVNTSCIAEASCCELGDCNKNGVTGQTCPTPGQPCRCDPTLQCCVPSDCPAAPNVTSAACNNNTCSVATCTPGCFDSNGLYADGCESCPGLDGGIE